MYKDFYKLTEYPFNITADPDFFFSSDQHDEALQHLLYGIESRKGIMMISGEIGTGKTTLVRTLLNRLDDRTKTALILNPNFNDLQLLQIILKDLGITCDSKDRFDLINALNEFLLSESSEGNNILLIIDESQNLSVDQLEQIRLLSNLETEKEKLLQILLVGQPELIDKLKLTELRQLNQRIMIRYHLLPLNKDNLKKYINHRLSIANNSEFTQYVLNFTEEAVGAIYEFSSGTPRMVNIICDRALLAGFTQETYTIDKKIILKCAREVGQR